LSPETLSFKAASVLQSLGYDPLPRHTASGFAYRGEWVGRIARRRLPADSLAGSGPGAVFFWRRFASRQMAPANVHRNLVRLADPPLAGSGSVAVMLTTDGRLLGLQAIAGTDSAATAARDSLARAAANEPWSRLLAQAGIDTARLVPEARTWAAPVATDSVVAWRLADPSAPGRELHVRAGAYRGRAVYFAIADSLGSATAAVEPPSDDDAWDAFAWVEFAIWVSMILAAAVLARRNLRLGRGDRRGAFRLAAFVFVATALETVFTWRVPENGVAGLVDSLLSDRALGHGMIHAIQMWLSYVALEPYVRRLWPRMLVSWARLASGRLRDPLVGRDVLVGLALGATGTVAVQLGLRAAAALRLPVSLDLLASTDLAALATYGGLGFSIAYNLSVTVLAVLTTLVLCLITHLFTKNDRATFLVAGFLSTVSFAVSTVGPSSPWPVLEAVLANVVLFVALFRFGLLTALACVFMGYVLAIAPPALDPAAWWSGRGMVVFALLGLLAAYGFWTALAGQPILGDPLQEKRPARA
jgi:hypothetical protein